MNAISVIASMLLNLSTGCDSAKEYIQHLGGDDYRILSYACIDKHDAHHLWRSWQVLCNPNTPNSYWGREYFLIDENTQTTILMNQFGEFRVTIGASIHDAYKPVCGS